MVTGSGFRFLYLVTLSAQPLTNHVLACVGVASTAKKVAKNEFCQTYLYHIHLFQIVLSA